MPQAFINDGGTSKAIISPPGLNANINVVEHGSTASTARPSFDVVWWVGSVEPTNMANGDFWVNTSEGPEGIVLATEEYVNDAIEALSGTSVQSADIRHMVVIEESAYAALDPPDPETFYIVVEDS